MLAAEPQYKNLISIDVWTMIFTFCNLMIVFFFAKKFLLGPVKKMIDSRQNEIDGMYEEAEKSVEDGEKFKAEYEEKLKKASEESEAIMRDTVRNARLREEAIIRDAREEASAILKRADEQIEMERRQAVNDIKNDVSGMAVDIAGAVLGRDIKPEEHAELIDSFIDRFGENDD
jgi:F-type H+-transporting ATPase subunit b